MLKFVLIQMAKEFFLYDVQKKISPQVPTYRKVMHFVKNATWTPS